MNKYATTALKAAELIRSGLDPRSAWERSSCLYFEAGSSGQKKGCPKNAFLGLYGINPTGKNAIYAITALNYLKHNPRETSVDRLWEIANNGSKIKHNSQMNVVLALWQSGYIR